MERTKTEQIDELIARWRHADQQYQRIPGYHWRDQFHGFVGASMLVFVAVVGLTIGGAVTAVSLTIGGVTDMTWLTGAFIGMGTAFGVANITRWFWRRGYNKKRNAIRRELIVKLGDFYSEFALYEVSRVEASLAPGISINEWQTIIAGCVAGESQSDRRKLGEITYALWQDSTFEDRSGQELVAIARATIAHT